MSERCRYFNGPVHNKECVANINYRNLVGGPDFGWMSRMPCAGDSPLRKDPVAKCDKQSPFTLDESVAQEKGLKERFAAITKAHQEIRKMAKEKNINGGWIHCPTCNKPLHFSIAKLNGHIWAKCETEGCIQWME
jgi:hypothetical protein